MGKRENPSNKGFSAWCKAHGFDMNPGDRSDAMWFASYPLGKTDVPDGYTHPKHIRQWVRDQAPAPSPELTLPDATPSLNLGVIQANARTINALANSARAGDETGSVAFSTPHRCRDLTLQIHADRRLRHTAIGYLERRVGSLHAFYMPP